MVEAFFGFHRLPFERDIPTQSLYSTPRFDELMSRLEHTARYRKFCVVTGEVGVGKSTAVRRFVASLDASRYRLVYITDSMLTPRVFYWEVLSQLTSDGGKPSFYRSEGKRKLIEHLAYMSETEHMVPVTVIDEAHLLSREMLEETRFLLNFRMDSQNPMALIVVGQSELRTKLSLEIYEPITQRIDYRFKLVPFDRAQTGEYIAAHLRCAGATTDIFSDSAVDAVYGYSSGIARKINKVCSLSLLCSAQMSKRIIDSTTVDHVVDEELTW
jgi:type II secretory pathway predicted ATPase ExeA